MEFRTQALDDNGDENGNSSGNDIVDKFLDNVKKELAKDPQKRVQLAHGLYENYGIDPQLTALFVPGLSEDMQQAQELQAQNQTGQTGGNGPANNQAAGGNQSNPQIPNGIDSQPTSETDKETMSPEIQEVTVDDIVEIIERFQEVLGDDATLDDVKEFVRKNEDIVQNEIETAL